MQDIVRCTQKVSLPNSLEQIIFASLLQSYAINDIFSLQMCSSQNSSYSIHLLTQFARIEFIDISCLEVNWKIIKYFIAKQKKIEIKNRMFWFYFLLHYKWYLFYWFFTIDWVFTNKLIQFMRYYEFVKILFIIFILC